MSGEKNINVRDVENQRFIQPDLDGFLKIEAEARESSIDSETYLRRKLALAHKWFEYYKKCKDQNKKMKLIDSYNLLAKSRQR